MRLSIFLFLFLLAPFSAAIGNEASEGSSGSVCVVSVPKSVFDLPEIALDKTKSTLGKIKDAALGSVKSVPEKIDESALALANKLESSKTPPPSTEQTQESDPENPQVLGASTDSSNQSLTASAYNAGIDVLGFLLRNWLWTISVLGAAVFFWAIRP